MSPDSRGYKWYVVSLLFAVAMLNYGDRTAISSVFPLLRSELGMSDVALASLGSLFLWTYAAFSPFAGFIADRFSRSRIVICTLTAWSLVTIWTGLARSTNELLVTRVLLGIAECGYLPAALALISDHHAQQSRATAIGIHSAGLNFGLVLGGTLAGYMGDHFGWRPSFLILGAAGLLLAALAWFTLRDGASSPAAGASHMCPSTPLQTLAALARIPSYWVLLVDGMLMAVGIWMFFNWLPLYFREAYQMSLAGAGFSGTFMLQAAATAGGLAGGFTSDRIAARNPNRRMLFEALCYAAAAPCLLAFVSGAGFALLSACIGLFAFFRALGAINQMAVMCDLLETRRRSTAIGLSNTVNCFAGGIGVFVTGYLKSDFGLGGIFAGISVITIAVALLLMAGYQFFLPNDMRRAQLEASIAPKRSAVQRQS